MYQNVINYITTKKNIFLVIFIFTAQNVFSQIGLTIEEIKEQESGKMNLVLERWRDKDFVLRFVAMATSDDGSQYETEKEYKFSNNTINAVCKSYDVTEPISQKYKVVEYMNSIITPTTKEIWQDKQNKLIYFIFEGGGWFSFNCMSLDSYIINHE